MATYAASSPPYCPRQAAADPEEEGEEGAEVAGANYDYLLSMPLSSLTLEKVEALKKVRPGHSWSDGTALVCRVGVVVVWRGCGAHQGLARVPLAGC